MLAWREARTVTRNLTLHHDRMMLLLEPTPVTLGLEGFQNGYPQGSFLWVINNIYFQYFSVLITIVSAVVMVAVSYATAPQDYFNQIWNVVANASYVIRAGRVIPIPAGLAVQSRDVLLTDMLQPAVTVVAQDPRAIGTLAAQLLFLRMDGDIAPTALHVVPTRLITRGSGEIAPPLARSVRG